MSKFDFTTAETGRTGNVMALCKSVIISMAATFLAMVLLAVLMTYGPVGEESVEGCITAAVIISIFTAALTASDKTRNRGWLTGIVTALIYMILMLLIGAVMFDGFSFGSETLKVLAMGTVSGCMGGIVGVNIKHKKKRK